MKKSLKSSLLLATSVFALSALASCAETRHDIEYWSCFGGQYTKHLNAVVDGIKDETGYDIRHTSQGSYDKILTKFKSVMATGKYPDIVTGYPDHFASYLSGGVLVPLNSYIEKYNEKYNVDLLKDYYPEYMTENKSLDIDSEGKPVVSALPFNKSTELMGYNGVFVDYCKQYVLDHASECVGPEWDLGTVPTTWQEWQVKGPKYRQIMVSFCKETDDHGTLLKKGKYLYGIQDANGHAHDFLVSEDELSESERGQRIQLLDFTSVDSKEARVISWDATDNMFITLIRQWGAEYTDLPDTEMVKKPNRRKGHVRFSTPANKQKVKECLTFFSELNKQKVFGVPAQLGGQYSSDAFKVNKVMFMLCSSGGLSYNTEYWNNRFTVAPLPYYDDGTTVRKFVISQGANIAMTNYHKDEEGLMRVFETMVKLTTGENQSKWCEATGYYPCSLSATGLKPDGVTPIEGSTYQAFLNETSYDDTSKVAYREGSQVNQQYYMNPSENWTKFVDDAFNGSSEVRSVVANVFVKAFAADANIDKIIKDTIDELKTKSVIIDEKD